MPPQQASFKDQVLQQLLERVVPAPYQTFVGLLSTDLARVVAEVFRAEGDAADRLDRHLRFFIGEDLPDPGRIDPLTAKTVTLSFLRELQYRTTTRPVAAAISRHLRGLEAGVPFVQPAVQPAGTRRLAVMGAKELQEDWNVLSRAQNWFKGRMKGAFTGAVEHVSRAAWKTTVGADLEKVERVAGKVGLQTPWDYLAAAMRDGWDEALWNSVIGRPFSRKLREDSVGILASATNVAQRHAINLLPEGMTVGEYSERINDFTRNYAARMVLETEQQSTSAVKDAVLRALTDGAGESEMARRIEWTWGLNPRYGQALENLYKNLTDQGKKMGLIRGQVSDYKDKLLADRAEMLANTETMVAMNFGRQLLWEDAVMRGVLPVDTKKVWVTAIDERVCEVCAPMDSVSVALSGSFYTKDNNVIVPPAHPRCRCTIVPESLVKEGIITRTSRRHGRNVSGEEDLRDNTDVDILVGKTYGSGNDGVFPGSKASHSEVGEHRPESASDEEVANAYTATTPPVSKHYGPGPHPGTGTPQVVHTGLDDAIAELDEGAYDFPTNWLKDYVRGSGIRIGQSNRIKNLANSILEHGFTKPITVWVYDETGKPFIRDGMHRLEAAHLLGLPRIPVAIHHVEGKPPRLGLRGKFHRWRIRRQGTLPRRDTPFKDVKEEEGFTRWFNERMTKRGERITEERPGKKPKEYGKPQKTWQRVKSRLPFVKYDEPPIPWEPGDPVEKHLMGQHDQKKHGKDKAQGFSFKDDELSSAERKALIYGGLALAGIAAGAWVLHNHGKVQTIPGEDWDDVFPNAGPAFRKKFAGTEMADEWSDDLISSWDDDRKGLLHPDLVKKLEGDSLDSTRRNLVEVLKDRSDREYGFLVHKSGRIRHGTAGWETSSITFTPEGISGDELFEHRTIHNHPLMATLSVDDVSNAALDGRGGIEAILPDGTVHAVEFEQKALSSRIRRGWEGLRTSLKANVMASVAQGHYRGEVERKMPEYGRLIESGELTNAEASGLIQEFAAERLDYYNTDYMVESVWSRLPDRLGRFRTIEDVTKWWEQMQAYV